MAPDCENPGLAEATSPPLRRLVSRRMVMTANIPTTAPRTIQNPRGRPSGLSHTALGSRPCPGKDSPGGRRRPDGARPTIDAVFRKVLLPVMVVLLSTATAATARASERPGGAHPAVVKLVTPVACPRCWHPTLNTSWQWQLSGTVDQSVDAQMYDIDLFENDASVVDALHSAGRATICYVNAGAWEDWRPDAGQFPASVLGKSDGWPGERWLDIRKMAILKPIMSARLDLCAVKGFDGVEFDNVDGFDNKTGFRLSASDQLAYNTWLANQAHKRGLSAALKNDLSQVNILLPYFDYAVNEQCFQYQECARLVPFVVAGKAVFQVEYKLGTRKFCSKANALNFNSLKKNLSLDAYRVACR
jgi:hypothetical protein